MTDLPSLTGAHKTKLRGLGQTVADGIWLCKDGVTPAFVAELERQFAGHELVKLRFTGGQDRHDGKFGPVRKLSGEKAAHE